MLIDVREPAEHAANRIAGAHLIPLARVNSDALPPLGGKTLVVHCLKGGRGQTAAVRLSAQQPGLDIYNLEGGISAWNALGLRSLSDLPHPGSAMPLDRQIQLTIGAALIVTCLLSLFVHPLFVALAAVFGVGLTVAGLTGFCGMCVVLAKMPWNQSAMRR